MRAGAGAIMMAQLSQWVGTLPISFAMRRIVWLVPTLQTFHILSIGFVLSSVVMIDLRVWGVSRSGTAIARSERFLPWMWAALAIATITGIGLMLGAPRSFRDGAFVAKLYLMVAATLATVALPMMLRRNARGKDRTRRCAGAGRRHRRAGAVARRHARRPRPLDRRPAGRVKKINREPRLTPITDLMHWVETTPVAIFVSQSTYGFSAIDMFHIAAIAVVFGTIAILDLRLIGVAFTDFSVTDLSRQLLPWTWAAFAGSAGALPVRLMFTGQAVKYAGNFAFLTKLALMAIAGLNVLVFHFITYRGVAKWDMGVPVPLGRQVHALLAGFRSRSGSRSPPMGALRRSTCIRRQSCAGWAKARLAPCVSHTPCQAPLLPTLRLYSTMHAMELSEQIAEPKSPARLQGAAQRREIMYRHGVVVRLTHWINALVLVLLLMSGLRLFNYHPALYWGNYGYRGAPSFISIAALEDIETDEPVGVTTIAGHFFITSGVLGVAYDAEGEPVAGAFPNWMTLPGGPGLALARDWHFAMAWLFVLNALVYLLFGFFSGHFRRDLLPTGVELRPRHVLRDIWNHIRLRRPRGEAARRYNVLQKLAYVVVVFVLLPVMVLTGLTMSPAVTAALPFLFDVFGGRQSARTIHFLVANLLVLFVLVHILQVVLTGVFNNMRSMITGRYAIRPEDS